MNNLRIEHTYGQIGVNVYKSELQISNKLPRLHMQHTDAKIQVDKQEPRVTIDQYPCFATAGLKNVFDLTAEAAQNGMQQAAEYAAKKASEGDSLANLKNRGNMIAEIARQNTFTHHEFNIDFIPKERPRIEVDGYIKLSAVDGQIETNVERGYADINFSPSKVEVYLKVKPSLRIEYVGSNFDASV